MTLEKPTKIEVRDLTMAYGSFVIMRGLSFKIRVGDVFVIMGGSGSGKSTLLKHMIGLLDPADGDVLYENRSLVRAKPKEREQLIRTMGVLFQGGALWSSMTLAENVALPLEEFTELSRNEIKQVVKLKLALVGLKGFEDFYPSQISGGMRKRAGLARAMALDPDILFFDEPSAGLDPLSSQRLDDLILELRDSLGTTIVVVTHELESIFGIADDSIFLDTNTRTLRVQGNPKQLRDHSDDPVVREFLTRGREKGPQEKHT